MIGTIAFAVGVLAGLFLFWLAFVWIVLIVFGLIRDFRDDFRRWRWRRARL